MSRTTDRVGTKSKLRADGKRFTSWRGRAYGRALKRARQGRYAAK